jgi:hypothetical protein
MPIKTSDALFVCGAEPILADNDEEDAAGPDLPVEHSSEFVGRAKRVDVYEKPVFAENARQPTKKRAGKARIVAAPVIDENLARHAPAMAPSRAPQTPMRLYI